MYKVWKVFMSPRVYMTVEPILLVFMFAQFLSYPVYQHLLYKIVCAESPSCNESFRNANETVCSNFNESSVEQEVQKQTSYWILYTNLAMGVPSILLSIFYGSVSDQLGRKLFIFLPALGAVMNTGVMLEVAYLPDQLPKYLFLIGAFASGLYGSYSVLNSTAYSYVADVTARSGRTRQIGLLESMTYLGATLSLLVGGIWISRDPSTVSIFWCILACQLAVMLYTVVALPESMYFSGQRSEDRTQMSTYTRKFSQAHKFSRACTRFLLAIHHNISGFCKLLLTNWRVSVLLLAFTVVEINFLGITDVVFLYAMGRPLCWGTSTVGYFLALKVFCNGLAALFILPVMLALQLSDTVITMVGLVSGGLGLLIMGVADRTWIMFLVPVVSGLRGCVVPCMRSMLSKKVPSNKQGVLFSSVGVLECMCMLLASVIYNSTYPFTRTIHPGFSFFMMATALVVPFALVLILHLTRNCPSGCGSSCCCHGRRKPSTKREDPVEREPLLQ